MKKVLSVLIIAFALFSCVACSSQKSTSDSPANTVNGEKALNTPYLESEEAGLKYVGIEKVTKALTKDNENQYLIKFDYTNKTSDPKQCQTVYNIKVYQEGVQIKKSGASYSSEGGKQYELMSNYFVETMDGGTVTFGSMYEITKPSDLTIILEEKNGNSTKFVVKAEEFQSAEEITPELIQEKLQGSWDALGQTITFEGNNISFGDKIQGTYTVSISESVIKASLVATDGTVGLNMPYTYENGVLKLYNNKNQEVTRK